MGVLEQVGRGGEAVWLKGRRREKERKCSGDFEVGKPESQLGCLLQACGSCLNTFSCLPLIQDSSAIGKQLLIPFFG